MQKNIFNRYLDVNKDILAYVNELDIFEYVFGFRPREFEDYIASPFREDSSPGCWFSTTLDGKLKFIDWGSQRLIKGKPHVTMDCFDCVKFKFNLKTFSEVLEHIHVHLIHGKGLSPVKQNIIARKSEKIRKEPFKLLVQIRPFKKVDKYFWYDRYGITVNQLKEDRVFPVVAMKLMNTVKGTFVVDLPLEAYCYTKFSSGKKKVYLPYAEDKKKRFCTDCTENDIGGLETLPEFGAHLIITKSYKDWRVLRNAGVECCIWFQNEGMVPALDILLPVCLRFKFVTVFFDSDSTGIKAAKDVSDLINLFYPKKSSPFHLPLKYQKRDVTDPADFREVYGENRLRKMLNYFKIL